MFTNIAYTFNVRDSNKYTQHFAMKHWHITHPITFML